MTVEDAKRWNARYDGEPIAEPSPPDALVAAGLVDVVPTSGRALDVACGTGGQSAWLASRGLDVVSLDRSEVAVALTSATADAAGVETSVDARVIDLDDGIPTDLGDFDVIVCQRFRGIHLYDAFVTRLRVGGLSIVTVLSQTGAVSPGPFHAPPNELDNAFRRPDAEVLFHSESAGQESIVVRRR